MLLINTYYPLIASLSSMVVSQIIKLIIMLIMGKKITLSSFTRSGGMPSSHSALITAISLSIGLSTGFHSMAFFISFILSVVVIYDARGIRHTVGKHAKLLNSALLKDSNKKLNEYVGHTLPEIIIGVIIGMIIPLGLYQLFMS